MTRHLTVAVATLFVAAGLGLAWIFRANTDLPVLDQAQWGEARLGGPARSAQPPPAPPPEFERAAKRGTTPYDARVAGVQSLLLELLILGAVLTLIAPELPRGSFALLAAGILACLIFSPFAPLPIPITSGLAALTGGITPDDPSADLSFWLCLGRLVPWGYAGMAWLAVVSLPAAALSLSPVATNRSPVDRHRILSLLALLAAAALLALAAYHASELAGRQLCFIAVVMNAAIVLAGARRAVPSALWFLLVLIPFLDPLTEPTPAVSGPMVDSTQTAEIRRQVAAGKHFGALLGVLPDSIRPPLSIDGDRLPLDSHAIPPLGAEALAAKGFACFTPGSAPLLSGLDNLPYWGNWSEAGPPYRTGDFTSAPFSTSTGIIQLRVAGTLHPPDTELLLKANDGQIYPPLVTAVSASSRWRRINFEVPAGEYRICATVRSPHAWLALTAPSEVHPGARFANKLVQSWAWWLGAGALLAAALAASAVRSLSPFTMTPDLVRAVPWLSLAAYLLLLSHHVDPTAGPNDSGGYLNSAKLLSGHHMTILPRPVMPGVPAIDLNAYLPGTFVATPDGRLAPTYPVGFPLIIAIVAQVVPLTAAVPLVILIHACLGLVFTYLLAREFQLSPGWAWLAAAIVGLSPVYLFQALQPQSDGPALVWVTAAVYWAWTSARQPWRALLAGIATSLAVLIRPSDALCMIPVAICLWGHRRQLALWIAGGIPGAIFQFWYNHRLYGHGLITGYGDLTKVSSGFGLRFAPLTANAYLHWLPAFFTPLVLLSLSGPWLRCYPPRARLMLALWAASFPLFYAFYWCTYDNWYNMRFILPAVPALVILGLGTTRWLCGIRPVHFTLRYAAALVLVAALIHRSSEQRIFYWMRANRVNADAVLWARDHLPANAVVVGRHITGPLFYYTDLALLRTDSPPARAPAFYAALAKAGRPVYALTFHWERPGFKWGNGKGDGYPDAPGPWEHLATLGDNEVHAWIKR